MGSSDAAFHAIVADATSPTERLVAALLELSAAEGGMSHVAPLLSQLACVVAEVDGASVEVLDGSDVVTLAGSGLLAGSVGTRFPRVGSLSGLVLATTAPAVCADVVRDTRVNHAVCRRMGIHSMAITPIRHADRTVATLMLASAHLDDVTERHLQRVEPLVKAASVRLVQAAAADSAAIQVEILNELAAASRQILVADDPGQLLVESIARIAGASHVYLMLPDGSESLTVVSSVGVSLDGARLPQDDSTMGGTAFVSGRPQIVADWRTNPRVWPQLTDTLTAARVTDARSAVYVPLETPDGSAGVVVVLLREPISASNADLLGQLRLLAAEAGIAITRDHLRRSLADQARTDPLTGLANRRVWNERLDFECERAKRTGAPMTIALLDLDFFKRFNDSYGHPAGDELLRGASKAWAAAVRPTDLLARLGGEEFGVILPDADVEAATAIMARLGSVVPSDQTVSIGVTRQVVGEAPATTMQRADKALYAAKAAGRNQVVSQ
jgi:diguanylate cyclase (GGDEF)-like protein